MLSPAELGQLEDLREADRIAAGDQTDWEGRFGPPRWLFDEPWIQREIRDVDVPALADIEVPAERIGDIPDAPTGPYGTDIPDVDAVAMYKPWHFFGEDWGIYFVADNFELFVEELAVDAQQPMGVIEPFAFHQLLAHELAHFDFEVVATELEGLLDQSLYREYSFRRYHGSNPWRVNPLEEAVATWEEIAFARKRSPPRPKGYLAAVKMLATYAPPGYRDWKLLEDDRRGSLMTASLASLIADRPLLDWPWGGTTPREAAEVPVRWCGDPVPHFLMPKSIARPKVRELERFLTKNGAEIIKRGGKGSHRKFRWNGKTGGYATSRPFVPKAECQQIARMFGLKVNELYTAIAEQRIVTPR